MNGNNTNIESSTHTDSSDDDFYANQKYYISPEGQYIGVIYLPFGGTTPSLFQDVVDNLDGGACPELTPVKANDVPFLNWGTEREGYCQGDSGNTIVDVYPVYGSPNLTCILNIYDEFYNLCHGYSPAPTPVITFSATPSASAAPADPTAAAMLNIGIPVIFGFIGLLMLLFCCRENLGCHRRMPRGAVKPGERRHAAENTVVVANPMLEAEMTTQGTIDKEGKSAAESTPKGRSTNAHVLHQVERMEAVEIEVQDWAQPQNE